MDAGELRRAAIFGELQDAEAAFASGDYDAVTRGAELAEQLARLGIAQTRYPPIPKP